MRIGIDIDNTITDTQKMFLEYCFIYDKTLRENGIVNYLETNVQNKFDWSLKEQAVFNNLYVEEILKNATIYDDAKKVINLLYDEGYEIYFITARSKKYCLNQHNVTFNWLKENGIKFHKLISEAHLKLIECKDNKIDIMLDDSYDIYTILNNNNVNCVLFKNKINDKMIDVKLDNFVSDWAEFYEYVKNIKS